MLGTSYDTSSDKFQNYYKDVSERVKNREVDILLLVNMFLTGFDATTLNTLWVDKNLRLHGLLQAYSRTNRILNTIKTFLNIIFFCPHKGKNGKNGIKPPPVCGLPPFLPFLPLIWQKNTTLNSKNS